MAGNIFGDLFRISTFGESHGKAIGVIIDSCPSGLELCEEDIQIFLDRRKPGQSQFSSPRKEDDICKIFSGTFNGKTTGTPIMIMVENKDQHSEDYSDIANYYRPGHADYCYDKKYGFRDYRGGGRSSGRETIARVIAGGVASKILKSLNIDVRAFTHSIGNISTNRFELDECFENPFYMPDNQAAVIAANYLNKLKEEKDSIGGIISCIATGLPVGLGEPVFDKLDANLAKAILSIGATKGIEFGIGFAASIMKGSQNNDSFTIKNNQIIKSTNNSGGILGGISDGSPLIINVAIKPTPSISKKQSTINKNNEPIDIEIKGRHDPIIVPRAVVVVESMVCITLVDALLKNMTTKMENLKKFYNL